MRTLQRDFTTHMGRFNPVQELTPDGAAALHSGDFSPELPPANKWQRAACPRISIPAWSFSLSPSPLWHLSTCREQKARAAGPSDCPWGSVAEAPDLLQYTRGVAYFSSLCPFFSPALFSCLNSGSGPCSVSCLDLVSPS